MHPLTDGDRLAIQRNIDNLLQTLATIGLKVDVESDLADWVRHMERAPRITAVSPSFDPRRSHLHPGNSFWISVRDQSGAIVACSCHRLFRTTDVRSLIASHRLFFDKKPILEFAPVHITLPKDTPEIAGRVAYGGGYWVDPDYRGIGLTDLIPRISRFLSFRHFEPDWNIALLKNTEKRRAMARNGFGVAHQAPCIDGYYPPDRKHASYQLAYMSAAEMLQQAYLEKDNPVRSLARTAPPREELPLRTRATA